MLSKMGVKVKKKMTYIFQKYVCLLIVLFGVSTAYAQAVDDIPLFFDEEEEKPVVIPKKTTPKPVVAQTKPVVPKTQPAPTVKPISFSKNPTTPNIGRNAEPLKQVGLLPPPAPELVFGISQSAPVLPQNLPQKVVNNRTESINLQLSPQISNNVPYSSSHGLNSVADVRGFELEGFYLGMTPDEVVQLARENGYKVLSSKKGISKFRAGYYESICKSKKIYLPADIRACIDNLSQQNDTTYLSELKISRPKTRDYMEFYFTSPSTDNRLWKIFYQNKGDNSLNFTRINTQKKLDRKEAFLNAVYNKFGHPDNGEKLIWGSENDAYMQIGIYGSDYDAHIILTDVLLSDEDYFEAEDWLQENKPFVRFGFED